jgi:predicted dienelactone hydrolase
VLRRAGLPSGTYGYSLQPTDTESTTRPDPARHYRNILEKVMKWVKRLAAALVLVLAAISVFAVATARRTENPVGLQVLRVESPSGPIAVAVWYPTAAAPRPTTFLGGTLLSVARDAPVAGEGLPVVVISHGNGGGALSHVDLAMELASAGLVAVAPTHAGDNHADQSRQGSPAIFSQRAGQVRAALDHVLVSWPGAAQLDPGRVGAYGMSAGAFTTLTLVGGTPDMSLIQEHCKRRPEFICDALKHVDSPLLKSASGAGTFDRDPRIVAAVVAAPGLGFTFAHDGLAGVRVPVQVWSGDRDETVPYATNTKVVQDGLGDLAQSHQVAGASHLSFLAPCGPLAPPAVCTDPEGFDREAAHESMNAEIIEFFRTSMPIGKPARER